MADNTEETDMTAELSFEDFGPPVEEVVVEGRMTPSGTADAGNASFDNTDAAVGGYRFWSVNYYRPLFNVDTKTVLNRLLCAIWPFRTSFFRETKKNPDLYGPFWICTTLIFTMAATSNLYSYLCHEGVIESDSNEDPWEYDFSKVTFATGLVYTYVLLWPLALGAILRLVDSGLKVLQVVCIYGYSMMLYIPVSVLCGIPSEILGWSLVLLCTLSSSVFLALNFFSVFRRKMPKRGVFVLLGLIFIHIMVSITFKLFFFEYDVESFFHRFSKKKK